MADGGVPLGNPIVVAQVPGYYTGSPAARNASGSFAIAWNGGSSIFVQRYAADGSLQGPPVTVTIGQDLWSVAQIAMNSSGAFALAWFEGTGIYLQYFDANGAPNGAKVLVQPSSDPVTFGDLSMAMDDSGKVVVSWAALTASAPTCKPPAVCYPGISNVSFAEYSGGGVVIHPATKVNSIVEVGVDYIPIESTAVAIDGTGRFIIAWNNLTSIQARRYSSAGTPIGLQFKVNTASTAPLFYSGDAPSVAADGKGDFVVAWKGLESGKSSQAFIRRYSSSGFAQGAPFAADIKPNFSAYQLSNPVLAMDQGGDFVVGWQISTQESVSWPYPAANYVERYDATGHALAAPYQVASALGTDGNVIASPLVGSDASGNFVVVWDATANYNTASATSTLLAQRFSGP
jgi:hypothetical protein